MAEDRFAPGSLVRHKSSGAVMTLLRYSDLHGARKAHCRWFEGKGRADVREALFFDTQLTQHNPDVPPNRLPVTLPVCKAEAMTRHPGAGDIVVTKVAEHYHVGRVQAEGTPSVPIQAMNRIGDALTLACELISGSQRVFLYDHGGLLHHSEIDCAKPYWGRG